MMIIMLIHQKQLNLLKLVLLLINNAELVDKLVKLVLNDAIEVFKDAIDK